MTSPWADDSPMSGRVTLVRGPQRAAVSWAAELARRPGWTGRPAPTGVVRTAGGWLAGFDLGGGTAGLSAMADELTFLAALRGLTDAPYLAAATADAAGRVVDVIEDSEVAIAVVDRLYPDAEIVEVGREPRRQATQPSVSRPPMQPTDSTVGAGLVVIVGSGRSGTTWLHRLLTSHPQLAGTDDGETWMFRGLGRFWEARQNPSHGLGSWLTEDELVAAQRATADALISAGRDRLRPGASHFVEKTPAHVRQLPMLARLYPEAAYIHLLRDGRDVALSLVQLDGAYDGPADAAAAWASSVRAVRAAAPGLARFTELRYESLLADPVGQAAQLVTWLGLDPGEEFRRTAEERTGQRISPLPSQGQIGAGKWRSMDERDRRAVDDAAGDLLAELGYV
ncbi:MAG TPA: sulfotransferase [Mycobacteriales bacterium]|nr:sulfotransferase [Mycobacteriales bacterium]